MIFIHRSDYTIYYNIHNTRCNYCSYRIVCKIWSKYYRIALYRNELWSDVTWWKYISLSYLLSNTNSREFWIWRRRAAFTADRLYNYIIFLISDTKSWRDASIRTMRWREIVSRATRLATSRCIFWNLTIWEKPNANQLLQIRERKKEIGREGIGLKQIRVQKEK